MVFGKVVVEVPEFLPGMTCVSLFEICEIFFRVGGASSSEESSLTGSIGIFFVLRKFVTTFIVDASSPASDSNTSCCDTVG